jgi:hypothetical protein
MRTRIAAVLADDEERTAFIREAVEREIERRESGQKRRPPRPPRKTR